MRSSRTSKTKEDEQPVQDARYWIAKKQDLQGLQKHYISDEIGWGVINSMHTMIEKGSFVLHYDGDLIDKSEAAKREIKYNKKKLGSYMFYFKHGEQEMCVDATKPTQRLGRLANYSKDGNCRMRKIMVGDTPHLCLFAKQDILLKEEISYDYGVANLPWRAKKSNKTKMECNGADVMEEDFSAKASLIDSHKAKKVGENDITATASPKVSESGT